MRTIRHFLLILIQIILLGSLSYQIAIGSGSSNPSSSSGCGATGGGGCGSTQFSSPGSGGVDSGAGGIDDGTSPDEQNLDAGFPIDIPVPIAKGIHGIDPSTLKFSQNLISFRSANLGLLAVAPDESNLTIGEIIGQLVGYESCSGDSQFAVVLDNEFVFTSQSVNCHITIPVVKDWLNKPLALVVLDDRQEQASHPVITKVSNAPNNSLFEGKDYILEILITNTSEETIDETQANIQDQEVIFLQDGKVVFQSLNSDGLPFLSTISPYGGANSALTYSEDLSDFMISLVADHDDNLFGYYLNPDNLLKINLNGEVNLIKSLEEGNFEHPNLVVHPSKKYLAEKEVISGAVFINIYQTSDLVDSLISFSPQSPHCTLVENTSMHWQTQTKLAIFKQCQDHSYELEVYDVSSIFNQSMNNQALLVNRVVSDYYMFAGVSDLGAKGKFYYLCEDENQISMICVDDIDNPKGSANISQTILSDPTASFSSLSLSADRSSFLIFEISYFDDDNTDNIVGYYDLMNQKIEYTGPGFRPIASSIDNDLVVCLGYDEFENIQVGLLNIDYSIEGRASLSIDQNVYVSAGQALVLNPQGGVPPYAYQLVSGEGVLNVDTGLFISDLSGSTSKVVVSDSLGSEVNAQIHISFSGSLDANFGNQGRLDNTSLSGGYVAGIKIEVDNNQRLLVAGIHAEIENSMDDHKFSLVRYLPSGEVDLSFGMNGVIHTSISGSNSRLVDLVVQPDNKIILLGVTLNGSDQDLVAIRFDDQGMIDLDFADDGIFYFDSGFEDIASKIKFTSSGEILIGGYTNEPMRSLLLKLDQYGNLIDRFGNHGVKIFSVGVGGSSLLDFDENNGVITSVGYSFVGNNQIDFGIAKLLSQDGIFDNSFGNGGEVQVDINGGSDLAKKVIMLSDSRILVVGDYYQDSKLKLAMLNSAGRLDVSFAVDGTFESDLGFDEFNFVDVELDHHGKILVSGYANSGNEYYDVLVRFNQDGSIDESFSELGIWKIPGGNSLFVDMAQDTSGNIYLNHSYVSVHKILP